jgi:type IV pilus assembly protein PilN
MYSLDVNFLRERRQEEHGEIETQVQEETSFLPSWKRNLPLILGTVVGITLPATVGVWGYLTSLRITEVEQDINQLEQQLSRFQNQQQQVTQKREELNQAQENLTAFANIFNQVKPVSAILEEVRDRAPNNIQINSIQQTTTDENRIQFELSGVGESYETINYFLLTLQRSPLVQAQTVHLQNVNRTNFNLELINDPPASVEELSPIPVITYTLSFQLTQQPASELLPTLSEQGAMGLVRRIQVLEAQGIVQ